MRRLLRGIIVAGTVAAAAVPLTGGRANDVNMCIDRCFSTYSGGTGYNGSDMRDLCVKQCGKSGGGGRGGGNRSSGVYGAIAYDASSGGEGISWGKQTMMDAYRAALSACRAYGQHCRVVASFSNACAALAAIEAGGHYATATAQSKRTAEAAAIQDCQNQFGVRCTMELSSCSP